MFAVYSHFQSESIATVNDVMIDNVDADNETKDTRSGYGTGTAKKMKGGRKGKNKKSILRRIGNRILRFACIRPKSTVR